MLTLFTSRPPHRDNAVRTAEPGQHRTNLPPLHPGLPHQEVPLRSSWREVL